MVLYFSGTGNSQYVALRLGELIGDDEVFSINRCLKAGKPVAIRSDRPLVFVAPTYSWRLPKVVERWILETGFEGSRDAYFVLTCGGGCGNAAAYARRLCAKKGLRFCGLAPVIMPENYLAMFPTPDKAESSRIVERAGASIAALGARIQAGQCFAEPSVCFVEKLESGPVNLFFYAFGVRDTGFSVKGDCVSCGKCALRCPMDNIRMAEGRPEWKGNCTHCMACIGGCPTEAIEYKSKSRGRRRHYMMNDALCWEGGDREYEQDP